MPGALIEDRRDRQFYAGRGAGAANEQDRTADSWSQIPDAKQVFRHPGRGVPAEPHVMHLTSGWERERIGMADDGLMTLDGLPRG